MAEHDFGQFELRLLGACDLRAPDGRRVSSVLSQPRRLALLAYLGLSRTPVSRSTLATLFWPESDEARARNSLSQAVFFLRRSLDSDLVQGVEGDRLWVPPERLRFDAREVLFADQVTPRVAALYDGEFLTGWNADDSQPLQEWLDTRRRQLRERVEAAESVTSTGESPQEPLDSFDAAPTVGEGTGRDDRVTGSTPAALGEISSRAARRRGSRRQLVLVLLLLVLAAGAGWMARRPTPTPVSGLLMVLLPEIRAMPGAPQLPADAVHNELLAQLALPDDMRMRSATSASSVPDLMRQIGMLESREQPGWALEVEVRANRELVRVTFRLFEGPPPWPDTHSEVFEIPADADPLVILPQLIAEGVADRVASILSR